MNIPVIPQALVRQIARGGCVLFLGSGVSYAAGLPSWQKMLEELLERVKDEQGELPNYDEIAQLIQDKNFLRAARAIKAVAGIDTIGMYFGERFANKRPTDVHKKICSIGFRRVLTTNYDDLYENAYSLISGSLPKRIIHTQQGELARLNRDDNPSIYGGPICQDTDGPTFKKFSALPSDSSNRFGQAFHTPTPGGDASHCRMIDNGSSPPVLRAHTNTPLDTPLRI